MARRPGWAPERRDVVWIDCNPQAGREMRDVYPVLVLSPQEFNARTGIVIGLPMTTAAYNATNPFAIRFEGPRGIVSYILAHQPKSFDWRLRKAKAHPLGTLNKAHFVQVCDRLNQIIQLG